MERAKIKEMDNKKGSSRSLNILESRANKRYNAQLSCSSNDGGHGRSSLNGLGSLFRLRLRNSGLRSWVFKRGNRSRLIDLGRVLVHLGRSGDLGLGLAPAEQIANASREAASDFESLDLLHFLFLLFFLK